MKRLVVVALLAIPLTLAGCGSLPPAGECQPGSPGYAACWSAWSAETQREQQKWPWVLEIHNKE